MRTRCSGLIVLATIILTGVANAQTFGPDFVGKYTAVELGQPAGIPAPLGGVTFLDDDTLLIGGSANNAGGAIYRIDVARDPMTNSITGFVGTASLYATAPFIDGGLTFGPGGILFYTGYSTNLLGQIKPGSVAPDKVIDLDIDLPPGPAIVSSVGSLLFVPPGFAGAGQFKVASFSASTWHTVTLAADGAGTFNISSVSDSLPVSGGPEGIVYIDGANEGFTADSILLSEWSAGRIGAYQIDANGDPILATRRDFITDLSGAEGAEVDAMTGDFIFSTYGGGDHVVVIRGFEPVVPEPASAVLALVAACGGWCCCRRRRRRQGAV